MGRQSQRDLHAVVMVITSHRPGKTLSPKIIFQVGRHGIFRRTLSFNVKDEANRLAFGEPLGAGGAGEFH